MNSTEKYGESKTEFKGHIKKLRIESRWDLQGVNREFK